MCTYVSTTWTIKDKKGRSLSSFIQVGTIFHIIDSAGGTMNLQAISPWNISYQTDCAAYQFFHVKNRHMYSVWGLDISIYIKTQKCIQLISIFTVLFRLDHAKNQTASCINKTSGANITKTMQLSGDFSSDAQFFVFTGVLSFLGTMASLVIYVFFSDMYFSESKKAPMIVSFYFPIFHYLHLKTPLNFPLFT